MKEYKLKDPKPLGEYDPKYGQTWWSYTHDSDMPLMFNLMEGSIGDGSRITAETVELKTSSKGTEYHRLRKVRALGGQQAVTTSHKTNEELILGKLDEILGLLRQDKPTTLKEAWAQTTGQDDVVVEDIGDEPINLDNIPF